MESPKPVASPLEEKIAARYSLLSKAIKKPRYLFSIERLMEVFFKWMMRRDALRVRLFYLIDAFPALKTPAAVTAHLRAYLLPCKDGFPIPLKSILVFFCQPGPIRSRILRFILRKVIQQVAKRFIVGQTALEAEQSLVKLRKQGFAAVLDLLGEATISEKEALENQKAYQELVLELQQHENAWPTLGNPKENPQRDWGYAPRIQLAIKLTGLYSQIKPEAFEHSVQALLERVLPIYKTLIAAGGALCFDMESYKYKAIVQAVYRQLREHPEVRHYPFLGIVLQAYLQDAEKDLEQLIDWAKAKALPITVRLVKGAYWDYERVDSEIHGFPQRVWGEKKQTDLCFERCAQTILRNSETVYLQCASHNIKSIASVLEWARVYNIPENRYEFQLLYGMSKPIEKAVLEHGKRVRLYCPYGQTIPGMAYLVRRLLENTSNTGIMGPLEP